MSKNSRRKRKATQKKWIKRQKSKNLTQNETKLPLYVIIGNPYYGKNINQIWSILQEEAKTDEETYQITLSELMSELEGNDPIHVLTQAAFYGLHYDQTKDFKKFDNDKDTFPFHIETLQALLLQIPPENISENPILPEKLKLIWDRLKRLCMMQIYRHINPVIPHLSEEEKRSQPFGL